MRRRRDEKEAIKVAHDIEVAFGDRAVRFGIGDRVQVIGRSTLRGMRGVVEGFDDLDRILVCADDDDLEDQMAFGSWELEHCGW